MFAGGVGGCDAAAARSAGVCWGQSEGGDVDGDGDMSPRVSFRPRSASARHSPRVCRTSWQKAAARCRSANGRRSTVPRPQRRSDPRCDIPCRRRSCRFPRRNPCPPPHAEAIAHRTCHKRVRIRICCRSVAAASVTAAAELALTSLRVIPRSLRSRQHCPINALTRGSTLSMRPYNNADEWVVQLLKGGAIGIRSELPAFPSFLSWNRPRLLRF